MLSPRQELILRLVVDAYLASARPVGSKEVAEKPEVEWGPSTVRAELAALEAAGYLTHPHTSAGRVPTDSGYRCYVDLLLAAGRAAGRAGVELELSRLRREVDEAMRETTAALAQVTDLMALATAPPESVAATIHRVEVLRLQPTRVMVVAIASSGAVAKRVFDFEAAVDPGLVEWASSYLNESLSGPRRRRADDRRPPRRPRARAGRGGVPAHARRGLHRARASRRDPLHGRRLAAALRTRTRRPAAGGRADDRARGPRQRAARAALGARRALGLPLDRRREPAAGAAHRSASSAPTTASPTATSARSGSSARCAWTTRRRSPPCASAARELSRYCETVYDELKRTRCPATTTRCSASGATPPRPR